jgi:transposase
MESSRQQQIVGLDVSKAWLDGYAPASGRRFRVSNDPAGIDEFLQKLGDPTGCLVVMEASGGDERTAHRELVAQGVLAAIVNPIERPALDPPAKQPAPEGAGGRVRDFARGMGLEAKTDRIDARLIARYGQVMHPAATPLPDPARLELREILAGRRQLVDEIAVRKQQLEHLQSPLVRAQVARTLAFLQEEAKALLALLRTRIAADAALDADYARLTSMPGCGPILAATLLAEMPELGRLDRRKIAALAGLAPIAKDSGLREHRRVIKGGRSQVRNALYMAALASLKTDKSPLKARYAQLRVKGKPPKLALAALMRNMLVTLNAMLKAKTSWKDPRQK